METWRARGEVEGVRGGAKVAAGREMYRRRAASPPADR